MKYSVDEIIDNVIKLENLETREIIYLNQSDLDFKVLENDVLFYKDGKYYKDEKAKNDRIKMLKEKLERLKNSQFKEWVFLFII